MIKIHRLKQPNKHSGTPLEPKKSMELRGVTITNKNDFTIFVDKFTRKPWKPSNKKKAAARPKKVAMKRPEAHAPSN